MWHSLVLKLGMLAATIAVVFWIGWTVPGTGTRPAQGGVQSDPGPISGSPPTIVSSPGSLSSSPTIALRSQAHPLGVEGRQERGKLDLNRAKAQELEDLPGIGPVLAERIVDYRKSGKTFRSVDDLREVKGIGRKTFERVRALVTVVPAPAQSKKGKKAA